MRRSYGWGALIGLLAAGAATIASQADAVIPEVGNSTVVPRSSGSLVDRLADPDQSKAALDEAVHRSDAAMLLTEIARDPSADVAARGWAVVGLSRVDGAAAGDALRQISDDGEAPMLVRTWAMSARVSKARTMDEVVALSSSQYSFPGLERPLDLKVRELAGTAPLADLLMMSAQGNLQQILVPTVLAADEAEMVRLIYQDERDVVRRQAAAFAATKATQKPNSRVGALVLEQIRFTPNTRVPWEGGALYVPGIQWSNSEGKALLHTLMVWWLHLGATERSAELNQVWNNLYSYNLLTANGYDMGLQADRVALVTAIVRAEGRGVAKEILSQAGLANDRSFDAVLR